MKSTNSSNDTQSSKDTVFLAISFRKLTAALAAALKNSKNFVVQVALPTSISILDNYEHQIDKVKTKLKNEMGEMRSMMKRIFQAIASQQTAIENSTAANQK